MRAFVAIELPEQFEDGIADCARQLQAVCKGRYIPRENYHVTLAFLGELDEAEIRSSMDALDEACEGVSPLLLRAEEIGKFGRATNATLWIGIVNTPEMEEFASRMREALEDRGIGFDEKPFKPHITVARHASISRKSLPAITFPRPELASRVTLFKSTLTKEGAVYKPIYSVEL